MTNKTNMDMLRTTVQLLFRWARWHNARSEHATRNASPYVMAVHTPAETATAFPPRNFKNGEYACPTIHAAPTIATMLRGALNSISAIRTGSPPFPDSNTTVINPIFHPATMKLLVVPGFPSPTERMSVVPRYLVKITAHGTDQLINPANTSAVFSSVNSIYWLA